GGPPQPSPPPRGGDAGLPSGRFPARWPRGPGPCRAPSVFAPAPIWPGVLPPVGGAPAPASASAGCPASRGFAGSPLPRCRVLPGRRRRTWTVRPAALPAPRRTRRGQFVSSAILALLQVILDALGLAHQKGDVLVGSFDEPCQHLHGLGELLGELLVFLV